MSERLCVAGCGHLSHDYLCRTCTRELVTALRSLVDGGRDPTNRPIPGLLANLEDTFTRQYVANSAIGVRATNARTVLPYHEHAAEMRWIVGNTVSTWARDIAETHPELVPYDDTTPAAAAWLANLSPTLARHAAADELHDEITHVVSRVRAVVDRDRDRLYLGPCTESDERGRWCKHPLYTLAERGVLTCPCGARYDIAERRAWLLTCAEDTLLTAAEISKALPDLLGHKITGEMIRGYKHRGRIVARPGGRDGRPRYRIGDVIDAVSTAKRTAV